LAALASAAHAQVLPLISALEYRSHINPGEAISLPFEIENPNERKMACGILFNFKDRPIWEGAAKLDPGERLRHTAKIDAGHFTIDARPVRARIAAVVEASDERQSTPMEIVFAPPLPLQPQCRFRIRGQHRIDGPIGRSDILADVSMHAAGSALRCRLLMAELPPESTWEVLYQPLPQRESPPDASHFVVKRTSRGLIIEPNSGPPTDARLESPPEAGDGRVLDIVFPAGLESAASIQIVLWLRQDGRAEAYCAHASTLDQARDPAYAPELIPRLTGATHRAWVRAGAL